MAVSPPTSLFPGKATIEGPEVKFRAVCALGWALRQKLPELRGICDELPVEFDVTFWIDFIETHALDKNLSAKHAQTWPSGMSKALIYQAGTTQVADFPKMVALLNDLAAKITDPIALDPSGQFADLNQRGFSLAQSLACDPSWSTSLVQRRWALISLSPSQFSEDNRASFRPVTAADKQRIELKVNTSGFPFKNTLHYYLTLEFQMMHEYISHLLPVWSSGNALEEEFLLAMTYLYYRSQGPHDGLVSLVQVADERRADGFRNRREHIKNELAPGQEPRLTQVLLELAVMNEAEMSVADKRLLLALLRRVPNQDQNLIQTVRGWVQTDSPLVLYGKLKASLP